MGRFGAVQQAFKQQRQESERQRAENPFAAHSVQASASESPRAAMGRGVAAQRRQRRLRDEEEEEEGSSSSPFEFDPEFTGALSRNFQFLKRVFSLETFLRPLPAPVAITLARNLGFFTRIFTQFIDPRGIKNAQKAMGIRKDDSETGRHKVRR